MPQFRIPSSLLPLILVVASLPFAIVYFYRAHSLDVELQPLIVEQDEYFKKSVEDVKRVQSFQQRVLTFEDDMKAQRRGDYMMFLIEQKNRLQTRGWAAVGLMILCAALSVFLKWRGGTGTVPLTLKPR